MQKLPQLLKKHKKIVLGLFIAAAVVTALYQKLGRDTLYDWDEGIYAQLGAELIKSNNILTPTWNRELWLEKPPGIAWITATGMKLFGVSEFGARFFMPLFAGITIYTVYLIGKKLIDESYGAIAALTLSYFNLFIGRGRVLNTDGPLLSFLTLSIYLSMIGSHPALIALAIFGGVWMKGLAGLLTIIIILPLLYKKPKALIRTVTYFLLYAAPWHIYQLIQNGQSFITPYFKEQIIRRITTPIEFHLESRWYYFTYLYAELGIGILLVSTFGAILALSYFFKNKKDKHYYFTLIWWVIAPLIIFTLAKTRLFWYILPIYPALALLISLTLKSLGNTKISKQILTLFVAAMLIYIPQKILTTLEYSRTTPTTSDKIIIASHLKKTTNSNELLILVSPNERIAKAILPATQRISSSFRYGGMPSVVFYYGGKVKFFYNTDRFLESWIDHEQALAMISTGDRNLIPENANILLETDEYLAITKGKSYAKR